MPFGHRNVTRLTRDKDGVIVGVSTSHKAKTKLKTIWVTSDKKPINLNERNGAISIDPESPADKDKFQWVNSVDKTPLSEPVPIQNLKGGGNKKRTFNKVQYNLYTSGDDVVLTNDKPGEVASINYKTTDLHGNEFLVKSVDATPHINKHVTRDESALIDMQKTTDGTQAEIAGLKEDIANLTRLITESAKAKAPTVKAPKKTSK